ELTPFLKFGADNVIAIRLDNPPNSSRWYPGGGIYRNVWLVKTAPVHVGHWGTYVTTPFIKTSDARVKMQVRVENDTANDATVTVRNEIFKLGADDKIGKSITSETTPNVKVAAHQSQTTAAEVTVNKPAIWSLEHPERY